MDQSQYIYLHEGDEIQVWEDLGRPVLEIRGKLGLLTSGGTVRINGTPELFRTLHRTLGEYLGGMPADRRDIAPAEAVTGIGGDGLDGRLPS